MENRPLPEGSQTNVKTVSIGAQEGSPQMTSLTSMMSPSRRSSGTNSIDHVRRSLMAFCLAAFSALSLFAFVGLNMFWVYFSDQLAHRWV